MEKNFAPMRLLVTDVGRLPKLQPDGLEEKSFARSSSASISFMASVSLSW